MAHRVGAGRGHKPGAQAVFFDLVEEYGRGKRQAGANGERTRKAGRGAMHPAPPCLFYLPIQASGLSFAVPLRSWN